MTDEEYENYSKSKNKILNILIEEVKNTISVHESFALLNDLLVEVVVASAQSGNIKGKNKAEIADNVRCMLEKLYKNAVKCFEENFFGEDDE